jgi:hypothetical protein
MDGELVTPEQRLATLATLCDRLDRVQPELDVLDRYYDGRQPLNYLAPEIRAQVGARLSSMVVNWPRVIVDSVQRRTYVEGFRVGDGGNIDSELARLWQENDLDEMSQLAQLDALVHARSYLLVWGNETDPLTPRITVESAHQMTVARRAGSRDIAAAVKRWTDGARIYATLYTPDEVVRYSKPAAEAGVVAAWEIDQDLENPLGAVPVVPLVNRPRLLRLDGQSELTDVIPLADAVNKLATDMLVASEFAAMPQRVATGIQIPVDPANRERLKAEARKEWDAATKGRTWLAGPGVEIEQLPAADLDNFVNAISMLTAQIAAVSGLPPHFLGINTDNPASADAIRAAEATLVERAQEKHRAWGGSYEQALRLAVAAREGIRLDRVPSELRRMETVWRDPATPTPAQSMDAAVKGVQAGIYDEATAQEVVGLSPQQRDAIADRRRSAAGAAATADLRALLDLADELQRTRGLSQNASLAAVGLTAAAAEQRQAEKHDGVT